MADSVYAVIVPIVIIVVVLKISLICCRIWLYQKRREQQVIYQQRRIQAQSATARVVGQMHIRGPGGIAQQTSYAIEQPGCPTQHLTRTIIVRPASRRPNDPNLPPSYDQAVTGADRSVKVQEGNETLGKNPLQQPLPQVQLPPRRSSNPPPPAATAPPPPPPPPESTAGMVLPHMPPRQNPAPVSAPPPYPPSPDIDISDRQRLLQ